MPKAIFDPSTPAQWTTIRWKNIEKRIDRLQYRIFKANIAGHTRTVRNLQRLLVFSLSNYLAVIKELTKRNRGITIGQKLNSNFETKLTTKILLNQNPVYQLSNKRKIDHRLKIPFSLKREDILEGLWNSSLVPLTKSSNIKVSKFAENYSPPKRFHVDIHSKLKNPSVFYMAYIEGEKLFSTINHEWLVKLAPIEKSLLRIWLKNKCLSSDNEKTYRPNPNSHLRSTLTTYIVDILETLLNVEYSKKTSYEIYNNVLKYKDKLFLFGRDKDDLKITIEKSLHLLQIKTAIEPTFQIIPVSQELNILGWSFQKVANRIFIYASKEELKKHKRNLKAIIKLNPDKWIAIQKLNELMERWVIYYQGSFRLRRRLSTINQHLFNHLWHWAQRRHPSKGKMWTFHRYWKRIQTKWTFIYVKNGEIQTLKTFY